MHADTEEEEGWQTFQRCFTQDLCWKIKDFSFPGLSVQRPIRSLSEIVLMTTSQSKPIILTLISSSVLLPVPQALGLARHTEAIPVVGEVAVNKPDREKRN